MYKDKILRYQSTHYFGLYEDYSLQHICSRADLYIPTNEGTRLKQKFINCKIPKEGLLYFI